MPPIKEFTTETTREREWDNIAAIHIGCIQTTTWSFHKSRMGEHRLIPEKFYNRNRDDYDTEPTCLILTHCGNFVVIGKQIKRNLYKLFCDFYDFSLKYSLLQVIRMVIWNVLIYNLVSTAQVMETQPMQRQCVG